MGNIIHREQSTKPKSALFTVTAVRAAGIFKAKLNGTKRKTTAEQIEEILEWKFRRKNTGLGHEEISADEQEREVMKFVHR